MIGNPIWIHPDQSTFQIFPSFIYDHAHWIADHTFIPFLLFNHIKMELLTIDFKQTI